MPSGGETSQAQKAVSGDSNGSSRTANDGQVKQSTGPISWAMRLAKANGGKKENAGEMHTEAVVESNSQSSGVRLPAGVSATSSSESSIKFGSIDPKQLGERGSNKDQSLGSKASKKSSEKQFFDNIVPGQSKATVEPSKRPHQPNHGLNRNQQPNNTRQAPVHMQNPQVQMSQNPYAAGQQYGMPYGQGYQGMGPGQYQAYLQAPFYPNFRPQMSYYGGSMQMQSQIGENISQQGVPPPPGHGSAAFSPSSPIHTKPAPVAREKRILRIEDPETHEALDLKEITIKTHAKAVENVSKKESNEPTEQLLAKTEPSTPVEEVGQQDSMEDFTKDQPESFSTDVGKKVSDEEGKNDVEVKDDEGKTRTSYTREFMLSIRPKCKSLPPSLEAATLDALLSKQSDQRSYSDRDWKANRPPPPPRGRGQGRQRQSGPESDTWERGKPLPPLPGYGGRGPPPGMRMPSGPLPALHKSDAAYKLGKTTTEDPEEEKAQKALKSMLNKITPENFNKITEQIIDKINERKKAKTLQGFINQIFDKALKETTFAELYADLVSKLNPALPDLTDDDGNPVNFRRALLNKCQEEFDYGVNAMKAVAEREKRAQTEKEEPEESVEGKELTEADRSRIEKVAEEKRQDRVAAEAEVKARKRMLGNIIFVGQLYRFGVLIEAVMHSCIKQLLEETEHPRPEDVECLCKLLTTVGRPMDASKREIKRQDGTTIKTSEMMEVYFRRIETLIKSDALDARHSFMLQDLVDLRNENWVERRKSEGPKKIGDIHRDAAIERSKSQQFDRQQSRGRGDRNNAQKPVFDNRVDAPIRTMSANKLSTDTSSLRPGGRPAPPREPKPKAVEKLSKDAIERKVKGLLQELFHNKDPKEALVAFREIKSGGARLPETIDLLFCSSLEGKGTSWDLFRDFVKALKDEDIISTDDMQQGIRLVLDKLEDIRVDVPKSPDQLGEIFAFLVQENCCAFGKLMGDIKEADMEPVPEGEDTLMIDSGTAKQLVGSILQALKDSGGIDNLKSLLVDVKISLIDYLPSAEREDANQLALFVEKFELAGLV